MRKRKKRKRRKKRRNVFLKIIFWVMLLFIFLNLPFFKIKEIKIEGDSSFKKELAKVFQENQNFFFFSSKKIENVLKKYPEIKKLEIKRIFPNKLFLKIIKRKEVANLKKGEESFILGDDGVVLKKGENKNLFLIVLEEKKEVKKGKKIFDKEFVKELLEVQKKLHQKGFFLKKVIIKPLEMQMELQGERKINLFLSKRTPLVVQIDVFFKVFEKSLSLEEKEKLEYIDLRYVKADKSGKVYFK